MILQKKNRYYNIDSMINSNIQYDDPLFDWQLLSYDILKFSGKKLYIENRETLIKMLDSNVDIAFYDLMGNQIRNAEGLVVEIETRELIQAYSVQIVFEIIRELVGEVRKLERQKYLMPVLSEFFSIYNRYLKPYEIRKKKDWLRT